jgi:hypothetical protein
LFGCFPEPLCDESLKSYFPAKISRTVERNAQRLPDRECHLARMTRSDNQLSRKRGYPGSMDDFQQLSRRGLLVGGGILAGSALAAANPVSLLQAAKVRPPALNPDLVKDFVKAAHVDLDKTKELLGNEPGLLNATWDWSAGDFEMAIGGAGHMGRRDIALFLVGEGGRMDLFVAAMLGELAIVKATLDKYPKLALSHGPHGIPLMAHAKAGGQPAEAVVEYLQSLKTV